MAGSIGKMARRINSRFGSRFAPRPCGGVYFDAGEITDFKYDSPRDLLMRLFAKRRD